MTSEFKPNLLSHDSIAVVNLSGDNSKLKLTLKNVFDGEDAFEIIYNREFGLRILNDEEDFYLDVDLQLGTKTTQLYVITYKQRIYIATNDFTPFNILYSADFPSKYLKDQFLIVSDPDYTTA